MLSLKKSLIWNDNKIYDKKKNLFQKTDVSFSLYESSKSGLI